MNLPPRCLRLQGSVTLERSECIFSAVLLDFARSRQVTRCHVSVGEGLTCRDTATVPHRRSAAILYVISKAQHYPYIGGGEKSRHLNVVKTKTLR